MSAKIRIADVQCRRLVFQPGDRVLVRSRHRLDRESRHRLTKEVKRWAGPDVEVFVVCLPDFDIEVLQQWK